MYTVKLEKFEGPFELLLELIEKAELDISDISLAKITDQFLAHINPVRNFGNKARGSLSESSVVVTAARQQGDISNGINAMEKDPSYLADFLVIAAKLILIKSKTMLPFFAVTENEDEEIREFKEKLAAYQKIRERSKLISELDKKHRVAYHKTSGLKYFRVFMMPEGLTPEVLLEHMLKVQESMPKPPAILEERAIEAIISFEEKIEQIKERLQSQLETSFQKLTGADMSKINIIITFLAVLELIRQKFLIAEQGEMFGGIKLART